MPDLILSQHMQMALSGEAREKVRTFEGQIDQLFDELKLKPDSLNSESLEQELGESFNDEAENYHFFTSRMWGENINFQLMDRFDVKAFLELLNVFTVAWFGNLVNPLDSNINTDRYKRAIMEFWSARTNEWGITDVNVTSNYVAYLLQKYYPRFLEVFPRKALLQGNSDIIDVQ